MPARKSRIILLTGAPDPRTLSAKNETLLDELRPEFQACWEGRRPDPSSSLNCSGTYPKWRSVATQSSEKVIVYDSFEQLQFPYEHQKDAASAVAARDVALEHDERDFLEQLFIANEDLSNATETSLLDITSMGHDLSMSTACTPSVDLSFITTITDSFESYNTDATGLLMRLPITDLRALPSHQNLSRLYPQTVTANLLGGIIFISAPRTVTINFRRPRQPTRPMEIIELLLGDETATGFRVTIWLTPPSAGADTETVAQRHDRTDSAQLRKQLLRLRPSDVVLLTHVALSTFRSKVYGQSLRRRGATGITTGVVRVGEDVGAGDGPNKEKVGRVREWANEFIGRPVRPAKRRHLDGGDGRFSRRIRLDEDLPDDTQ